MSSGKFSSKPKHFWYEFKNIWKTWNSGFNLWKSHPTSVHCIEYKRKAAFSRKLLTTSKRETWKKLTGNLNFCLSESQAWNILRKILDKYSPQNYPLTEHSHFLLDDMEKAERLSTFFQQT